MHLPSKKLAVLGSIHFSLLTNGDLDYFLLCLLFGTSVDWRKVEGVKDFLYYLSEINLKLRLD